MADSFLLLCRGCCPDLWLQTARGLHLAEIHAVRLPFRIILFFLLSLATGQLIRATNIVEVVDWGRFATQQLTICSAWSALGQRFHDSKVDILQRGWLGIHGYPWVETASMPRLEA